ncbi:Rho GTPase-activating protein 3 [Citrus sinensis]|uniref:Rho GTPase-activating protein 3 n=1 Tax=Citrus sinensis TaxID=2711 RepID=A0ACB8MPJ9_CITSI|nr:Rho GTPase-activating protein 3 [Citrus sinensis]
MTRHFRSKSCGFVGLTEFNSPPPSPFFHHSNRNNDDDDEEEEEFECDTDTDNDNEGYDNISGSPLSTPFIINPGSRFGGVNGDGQSGNSTSTHHHHHNNQFQIRDILVAALRKSLVTCSVEGEDEACMDISWPTEVRHVSHVTFDRFNGFLGLPTELEPEIEARQLHRNKSGIYVACACRDVSCVYVAEGIFRINAENSQEEYVRDQLNKGVVPHGIDVHCLAGLIKAWLRELPTGVLDSLTSDQVMHCNTEEDCTQLVKLLPPSEAALLDWAINLMADVVQHEQYNKMNARNIAMVFAPNMTQPYFVIIAIHALRLWSNVVSQKKEIFLMQMADPLTALIHAVQVMNFLKTLILKILREREEAAAKARLLSPCSDSPNNKNDSHLSNIKTDPEAEVPLELTDQDSCTPEGPEISKFSRAVTLGRLESDAEEKFWNFHEKSVGEEDIESVSDSSKPALCERETGASENGFGVGYNNGDWLSLRRGVRRLCRHPLFQLGKPAKKTRNLGIVNTEEGGGEETCA